jgi:hypothetical protein
MSIAPSGVKIEKRQKRNKAVLLLLVVAEIILSIFVYIALAANIIWPEKTSAVSGIARVLSYEGRLTDSSGNPLGGSGTPYCFRFSIYDDATVGPPDNKLWPSGTPTGQSITVTDGVFDALIGTADTLDFDFYSNDSVYLNVEVATKVGASCTDGDETWETMSDRQRIAATGYAIAAANVYSDLLKTNISAGTVQIGSGVGASTPKYLALDVKNTSDTIGAACSPSGAMWYNSNNSQALICASGTIRPLENIANMSGFKESGASATINAGTLVFLNDGGISISQSTNTLATNQTNQTVGTLRFKNLNAFGVSNIGNTAGNTGSQTGTIVLSGQGNITLSQITGAGGVHTIGISAAGGGGGGGGVTFNAFQWPPHDMVNLGAISGSTLSIVPIHMPAYLSASSVALLVSGSGATSVAVSLTASVGIYTRGTGASTSLLSLASSASTSFDFSTNNSSNTLSYLGLRRIVIPGDFNFTPGDYWYAVFLRNSNATFSVFGGANSAAFSGNMGNTTASSLVPMPGFGIYSASFTSAMPNSVAFSAISGVGAAGRIRAPWILFTNF